MTSIAMQFKDAAKARKKAINKDRLAAEYEADTIRQTAEDYDQYQLQLNSLEIDLKRLSGLSPGDKDRLKRDELIPKYYPQAQDYMDQGDGYKNLILVEVVIMMLDVGQIPESMNLALCAAEQKQPMPDRFKKTNLHTFIADSVLNWANIQIAKGQTHDPEFSEVFDIMREDGWKVPRELIAKYHKLAGDVELGNNEPEQALDHFIKATEIDPVGAKCATKIKQIKKQLDTRGS